MDVGLMVEGQHGLNWENWRRILATAERLRFPTVFRSDHYFMLPTHQQDSLDPYLSFTLAAAETEHIRFGPLVTPITFRHPVNLGRMAAQIDLLSGGRFVMGVGAGWNVGEHAAYGLDFPSTRERFDRLSEGIEVMRALWGRGPPRTRERTTGSRTRIACPSRQRGVRRSWSGGAGRSARCGWWRSSRTSGIPPRCRSMPTAPSARCWSVTARRWGATRRASNAR